MEKAIRQQALDNALDIKIMLAQVVAKTCREGDLVEATNRLCSAIEQVKKAIDELEV